MKKLALFVLAFVFVLLGGCAQPPGRLSSTWHEEWIAVTPPPQPIANHTAPERRLPEVPPLAAMIYVPDSAPGDISADDSAAPVAASNVDFSSARNQTPAVPPVEVPTSLWPRLIG